MLIFIIIIIKTYATRKIHYTHYHLPQKMLSRSKAQADQNQNPVERKFATAATLHRRIARDVDNMWTEERDDRNGHSEYFAAFVY